MKIKVMVCIGTLLIIISSSSAKSSANKKLKSSKLLAHKNHPHNDLPPPSKKLLNFHVEKAAKTNSPAATSIIKILFERLVQSASDQSTMRSQTYQNVRQNTNNSLRRILLVFTRITVASSFSRREWCDCRSCHLHRRQLLRNH